ncbi:unnamed protein product [Cuscuta campestris]|uniref:Reverse transcriptase domain-containing protein n=1 Tax=Cuscuta campestris TaxID=132261 RepID=A0A484MVK3_9ASTE|nr:unnamed protein product [Cuscuta campestris]
MQLEHQFRTTNKGSLSISAYCQTLKNIADWLDDVDAPVSEQQLVLQRTSEGLFLHKTQFAQEILERANMLNFKPVSTPVDTKAKLGASSGIPLPDPTLYKSIVEMDNAMLTALPSLEEVKNAVWALESNSASGPDGYNGLFFRTTWDIIKQDMLKASQEFFLGFAIPRAFGSTLITLIPKKDCPKSFDDYRPISLSTFMSKFNTKILACRLKTILPKIISKKAAFQKGKCMSDHILLAMEALHNLNRKTFGGNIILKIDMAKAFDTLRWDYLEAVLLEFGFGTKAASLLMANLKGSMLSVLINRQPAGYFPMTRGVKQGDPLSPLLFIIVSEGLSRLLNRSMEESHIHHYNMGSVKFIGHLTYADDIMIFTKGDSVNYSSSRSCWMNTLQILVRSLIQPRASSTSKKPLTVPRGGHGSRRSGF